MDKRAPVPQDVASRVMNFVEDHYGEDAGEAEVVEGLWLAMQWLAGPVAAARVMRQCGVNFVNK